MGSSKKQIMASIEKVVNEMGGISIRQMEIDGEKVDKIIVDENETGLMNVADDWFFPLEELTVNELKSVKTAMNKNT